MQHRKRSLRVPDADNGHEKATRYQTFGTRSSRWGSFAKIGNPRSAFSVQL